MIILYTLDDKYKNLIVYKIIKNYQVYRIYQNKMLNITDNKS